MNRSFSPLKCVAWWLYVVCFFVFVAAFVLGRLYGAQPLVRVEAMANGEKLKAEVYIGNNKVGETAAKGETKTCELRGRRAQKLEYTLKYDRFQKTESFVPERGRQTRITDFTIVAINFCGYDTGGLSFQDNNISAEVKTDATDWTPMPARLTLIKGTKAAIQYRSRDPRYAGQGELTTEVEWSDKATYLQWLEKDLWTWLSTLDKGYTAAPWQRIVNARLQPQTTEAAHDFPCIFVTPAHIGRRAAGTTGGGPVTQPPPPPPPWRKDPNAPIPYEVTSKQALTAQDLAGKTDQALRVTVNDMFAHNGYRFSTPEFRARYKDQPWYRPTSDDQEQVKAGITDPIVKRNLELVISKRK
jgi:hypothetical protein